MDTDILSFISVLSLCFYSFKISLILNYNTVTEATTGASNRMQVFNEE